MSHRRGIFFWVYWVPVRRLAFDCVSGLRVYDDVREGY